MISANTTVGELMLKYPGCTDVLSAHGLKMAGCSTPFQEPLSSLVEASVLPGLLSDLNAHAQNVDSERPARPSEFEITQNAVDKVNDLMKKQGVSGFHLRVEVRPGGCAGFTYDFSLDDEVKAEDVVLDKFGLKVTVDRQSAEALKGAVIDYVETLNRSGFRVDNPNAHAVCSCGSSFG